MGTLKKNKSATPGSAVLSCHCGVQFCRRIVFLSLKLNVNSVLTFLKIKGDVYK
jgi:hypothetical protein